MIVFVCDISIMFSYNFFYRYYFIFVMIFPSLFYIPKFFEYENVNVYKNYTLVRPCQFPIDFAICRPVVLKNNSDLSNVTNDISNVTNTTLLVKNNYLETVMLAQTDGTMKTIV